MTQHNVVPGFQASVHGLQFANSWPHEPDIVVKVGPLGSVPIGDASNGLCGGMVYTVIDVFRAGLPPIPDRTNPAHGTPLFNYLVSRLFASFDIPGGVLKYYDWMTTPDADTSLLFVTRRGVAWHTITEEWPRIKADIDTGTLSPLGLVTVYTTDPSKMGQNHQVLAYGYDLDDDNKLTLYLYDPNTEPEDADFVRLTIDLSDPTHASPINSNVNIGNPIRGFFRTRYAFSNPAALEPPAPPPHALYVSGGIPSPLAPGSVTSTVLTFQNTGGASWLSDGPHPFRLGAQSPQDNATWGTNRFALPHDVAPGEQVSIPMQVTAPAVAGTYQFAWRMVQEGVSWFGDTSPDVPVVVQP